MKYMMAFLSDSEDAMQKLHDAAPLGTLFTYKVFDDDASRDTFKIAGECVGLAMYRGLERRKRDRATD